MFMVIKGIRNQSKIPALIIKKFDYDTGKVFRTILDVDLIDDPNNEI